MSKDNPQETEFSKKIVKYVGIYVSSFIYADIALMCIFPFAAPQLLTVCLTVIGGCLTVFSWYFAKAYGENKIKISASANSFHNTVKAIGAGIDSNYTEYENVSIPYNPQNAKPNINQNINNQNKKPSNG